MCVCKVVVVTHHAVCDVVFNRFWWTGKMRCFSACLEAVVKVFAFAVLNIWCL